VLTANEQAGEAVYNIAVCYGATGMSLLTIVLIVLYIASVDPDIFKQ
jgi:hypothetical protein